MENHFNKIEIRDSLISMNQNDGKTDKYSAPKNLDCPISSAIEYPNFEQVYQNNKKNCQHLNLHLKIDTIELSVQFNFTDSMFSEKSLWTHHWLHYYDFDREYIEKRMHSINLFRSEEFLGKKFKHKFVISCTDCGEIIKTGIKSPPKSCRVVSYLTFLIVIFIIIVIFFLFIM